MKLLPLLRAGTAVLGLALGAAHAGVVYQFDGNGELTGAKNVLVNGSLYDVEFKDGTCYALYDLCTNTTQFVFNTEASAHAASLALLSQVFVGAYDTDSTLLALVPAQIPIIGVITPYAMGTNIGCALLVLWLLGGSRTPGLWLWAGALTTLCALAFHEVFACGTSLYGIGDLQTLAQDTHKFEAHYLDRLVGPWPAARDTYLARSPLHHLQRLNCPLLLLQGADDPVVPPQQSRRMHAALKAKGVPVAYLEFEGEQHGFRDAKHMVRALRAEAGFYARVLGFTLADAAEPIAIDNL